MQGLTEWQLNSYYAAGRVMVPALLDVFTVQGFFKRQALLDLMTELTGIWVVGFELECIRGLRESGGRGVTLLSGSRGVAHGA